MCICIFFVCFCMYFFDFCSYKIDRLMGGGRLRRPPLIKLSILYEKIKIYTKKHIKNMQMHINICKNEEAYIKKYKHMQEEHLA